jgi:hypothetical protein
MAIWQQPLLVEFHEAMTQHLKDQVSSCEGLPSKEEVCGASDGGKDPSNGEQRPWKWISSEEAEAQEWIDCPINRVRFLRAR